MKKEITFLLDTDSKDYTGLAYSYLRAYEKAGYDTTLLDFNIDKYVYRALRIIPGVRDRYVAMNQKEILKAISNSNAKVVFVIKGYYLLPSTIEEIKSMNKMIVCFNPDDPFSTIYASSNANIKSSIKLYDAYFIWHERLVQPIQEAGCSNVYYIPFAADLQIIKTWQGNSTNTSPTYDYDVSFIGNADKKRQDLINDLAISLTDWDGKKGVFGYGWGNPNGFTSRTNLQGDIYLQTMHRSKVNLNVLRDQNINSHNMRTFEIPASGSFMLHEYSDEAIGFFKEGIEAEFFRDADECADKIKFYCKNGEQRKKIARAGFEKIFSAGYTYDKLVNEIIEKIDTLV